MNALEKWFFWVFLLWSKNKEYSEFTGVIALMTFGLSIIFNLGSIILICYSLGVEFGTTVLFESRLNVIVAVALWFSILAILLLRKKQLEKYRKKIDELTTEKNKQIANLGLVYSIGSIFIGFAMALIVNNIVN